MQQTTMIVDAQTDSNSSSRFEAVPAVNERTEATLLLFYQALEEVNRLERRPVCSAIEYVMRQWRPELDLPSLGWPDIESLVALAEQRGMVRLAKGGKEVLIQRHRTLNAASPTSGAPVPTPAPDLYRQVIERKLKCPLPSALTRRHIFVKAEACLTDRGDEHQPISLLDLSYSVEERMGKTIEQRSIFKLLFALVLGGAFAIAYNECLHKIGIIGPCATIERWDDMFVGTCLAGLRRDRPTWPLPADILAHVLDAPTAHMQQQLEAFRSLPAEAMYRRPAKQPVHGPLRNSFVSCRPQA